MEDHFSFQKWASTWAVTIKFRSLIPGVYLANVKSRLPPPSYLHSCPILALHTWSPLLRRHPLSLLILAQPMSAEGGGMNWYGWVNIGVHPDWLHTDIKYRCAVRLAGHRFLPIIRNTLYFQCTFLTDRHRLACTCYQALLSDQLYYNLLKFRKSH